MKSFGSDVMQSLFGVKFLFWSGEFEENCRRISQRILMANFGSEFFGLVFPGFQATQKIHAQNSRPELSAFLSNFTFLNPKFIHGDFLLTRETSKVPDCKVIVLLPNLGLEIPEISQYHCKPPARGVSHKSKNCSKIS